MHKKYIKMFIVIVVLFLVATWVVGTYRNLKFGILAPAQHLYIEKVSFADGILKVEGSLSDSAYLISRYEMSEEDDAAYLSIWQGFLENEVEPTPYIDYSYQVPDFINHFYIKGAKGTLRELWNREQGSLLVSQPYY